MSYNVLIVDDFQVDEEGYHQDPQLSGFHVGEYIEASNGQEALDQIEGRWIDLILSDIHMPVMDGFEFIRCLREDEMHKDTPVIFVTTEASEVRLNHLMALGARGYIRKPFRPRK